MTLPRSHTTDELALMSEFNVAHVPLQKAKIGLLPNALAEMANA
ncbi:hypothetical protein GCM10023191_074070 [Actinoallomurus oryzae]|uniref:Uncharacterized protein n=1 Tax=Actinoallomurus oryzae TaxID=502180 RepID=A0ABP8QTX4_9ACTN